ncbi:MAG: pyrroline-5-carboxylate reductase family protein [Myxococcota bacterium]
MKINSLGFIGGGRITRIILNALKNSSALPEVIKVSDVNPTILNGIKERFAEITMTTGDNLSVIDVDLLFLAVHPQVIKDMISQIKDMLRKDNIIISLAPKFTIKQIRELLGYDAKIVRMIPNANTYCNRGFNPISFGENIDADESKTLKDFFSKLGESPVVNEDILEAYAVITGMGPAYLWFQFKRLFELGREFGMSDEEAKEAIFKMISGAVYTLFKSGLSFEEVIDLIPVKPLSKYEAEIINIFDTKLREIYKNLVIK